MTVNMDKDYEELYLNLNSLLQDICTFLHANCSHLTPADKKKADALIERSKNHLEIIERFSDANKAKSCDTSPNKLEIPAVEINKNETERYVDMTKKTALPQRTPILDPPVYESKCPFQDLPAKEASQEIKYGTLTKRRKVLNIIDVSTKIYAVIHDNWLLLYHTSKDLKPDCALDLKQYEAKEDESDPNMTQLEITKDGSMKKNILNFKMASSFKVFDSSGSQKKSYNFVANTHKDMLQWVVNINRRHDKAVLAISTCQDEQTYEICQEFQELEEENIYNEIEMPCRSVDSREVSKENKPPAVPEKRIMLSEDVPSRASIVSYEELEQKVVSPNTSERCSLASFETSDDEDQTYYELDTVTKTKLDGKEHLENNEINFYVPPPSFMSLPIEIVETNTSYENGLSHQTTQSPKVENTVDNSPSLKNELLKPLVPSNGLSTRKSSLPGKTFPNPPIQKPKIISPKPWKPFKKSILSKSPQISKNKPIRESLKGSHKLEKKTSLEKSPRNDPTNEYSPCKNDPKTSNDICALNSHQGSSIVQIVRNRWSTSQSLSCSLETFSRNTKIETFQASPPKETSPTDFLRFSLEDINNCLCQIDTCLIQDLSKNGSNEDEKPMVLLKPSLEDEDNNKKLKKSPVVPVRPKKVAKKLLL